VPRFVDDLPVIKASSLRASGAISVETTSTVIEFGEEEFAVGVTLRRFRNGGNWSLFRCPRCERRAQTLRLLEGRPACRRCCKAQGLRSRIEPMSLRKRAEIQVPKVIAQLDNDKPARLHPRPGRKLDRRPQLEASLRRNLRYMRANNLRKLAKGLEDP
jgi:hypothetical protein